MRNIWMLTAANYRKNRLQAASLFGLMLVASMILNVGVTLALGVSSHFEQRAEELHSAHFAALSFDSPGVGQSEGIDSQHSDAWPSFFDNHSHVTEVEVTPVIAGLGGFMADGHMTLNTMIFAQHTDSQRMNPATVIGDSLPLTAGAVYLPHSIFLASGQQLGGLLEIEFLNETFHFTIAGSTEEILLGSIVSPGWRLYVNGETFDHLSAQFSHNHASLYSVRSTDPAAANGLLSDFRATFPGSATDPIFTAHFASMQTARTFGPTVAVAFIAIFSLILLTVALVVMRTRIADTITETMVNNGVLKALGYRSRQIIGSIVLQFSVLASSAALLGVVAAQLALPLVAGLLEPMLGLPWNPSFDLVGKLVAFCAVSLLAASVAYLSSRKIRRLPPLLALRGGLTTHNFRRNPAPLECSPGPLTLLLAVKDILQHKWRSAIISCVIAGVTFASVASISVHYAVNVETTTFLQSIAGEPVDMVFYLNPDFHEHGDAFRDRLADHPQVDHAFGYVFEGLTAHVNDNIFALEVVDHPDSLIGSSLIRGRFPIHRNEIALGTVIISMIDREIGDVVSLDAGHGPSDFLITGTVQSAFHDGILGLITQDAATQLIPDFSFVSFAVHLASGVDPSAFLDEVKYSEGEILAGAWSFDEQMAVQIDAVGSVFEPLAAIILTSTAAIVALCVLLLVRAMILRKNQELGIYKALGFTTFSLMNQISLSLLPAVITGVLVGAVSGVLLFNPLVVAALSGIGVGQISLPSPMAWIVATALAVTALAYLVAMATCARIRNISPYKLVQG